MLANPHRTYMQAQVDTVSPQQLVIMLYSGAVKFTRLALAALNEKNIEKCHTNIIKAQDIITELMSSLDMEQGAIANQLYLLYDYMNRRLLEANLKKDRQPLEEVEALLTELRDTWVQAARLTT